MLTAAHCIEDLAPWDILVATKTIYKDAGDYYEVVDIVIAPGYPRPKSRYDLALVKTTRSIAFSPYSASIPIATTYSDEPVTAITSGWGRLSFGGEPTRKLQFLPVKTLTEKDCEARYGEDKVDTSNLCALTKKGEGLCHGDAGGPLVADYRLIGIASRSKDCAIGFPDVYMRVSTFANWINAVAFQ